MTNKDSNTELLDSRKELETLEKTLVSLNNSKRNCEKKLSSIESHLFTLEVSYLNETNFGNLVKGFDGYIGLRQERKRRVTEADRIFSGSSVGFKPIDLKVSDDEFTWESEDSEEYSESLKRSNSGILRKKRKLSLDSDEEFS